jgi:hypothetical protein
MAPRFQEKVPIQPIQTSTGTAQGMMSLADRLESFKSLSGAVIDVGVQKEKERAVQRGIKSAGEVELEKKEGITQAPEKKEKTFFGGIEAAAHNKALGAAYLASLSNDVREGIGRIEAENQDNLIGFNESIKGWAKGMLEGVDPSVRQELSLRINDRATTSRLAVQNATIEKQNKEASEALTISSQKALDEALTFSSNGDLPSAASGLIEYNKIIDSQVEAGFLSNAAAQEKKRDAELRATHENLVGNIRRIANGGKSLDAVNLITEAQQKIPTGMSVDEHQDLTAAMIAELNQGINNKNREDIKVGKLSKQEQSLNYSNLAIGVATGKSDANSIIRSLKSGNITEQQFDKLLNTLNKRGQGVDSFQLINLVETEIRQGGDGEAVRNTIISNIGTNLTESTGQRLLDKLNEFQDEESILKTGNVTRARGYIIPSIRVTGPLGALDSEAEGRLANAIREFDTRVLEGEDPWEVADQLVDKDALERIANPMFGTKDNLETSLDKLNQSFDKKEIDEATYNFEFNKIQSIKELKTNIESFNKAKKEANDNAKQ